MKLGKKISQGNLNENRIRKTKSDLDQEKKSGADNSPHFYGKRGDSSELHRYQGMFYIKKYQQN